MYVSEQLISYFNSVNISKDITIILQMKKIIQDGGQYFHSLILLIEPNNLVSR